MDTQDTQELVRAQHAFFNTNKTKSISWRLAKLRALKASIRAHEDDILAALEADLSKSAYESYVTEIGLIMSELNDAIRNVRRWARPQHVSTALTNFLATSKILHEPYGVVLIMAPWNYPFLLTVDPIIGAVAAGNCFIAKPSDYSPATSAIIKTIVDEVFEPENGATVLGGREANTALLEQKYDYIFFTGSTTVGRIVMDAAAKNVTPLSLELGGKSPCIIDETANIELAAKRVTWGKYLNAGQTCVAPDYVYVHRAVKDKFVAAVKRYITQFYGENPLKSADLVRIVNQKHFDRLRGLVENETPVCGGAADAVSLKIEPSVYEGITWESPLMSEEIFGPFMPILTYESLDDVIAQVKAHNRPLALYVFTTNKEVEERVLSEVSFGGGCVNDTVVHLASTSLPFGGVGASGMGNYHGKYSFETFSHQKSILKKSNLIDVPLRYAPYDKRWMWIIKKLMG